MLEVELFCVLYITDYDIFIFILLIHMYVVFTGIFKMPSICLFRKQPE